MTVAADLDAYEDGYSLAGHDDWGELWARVLDDADSVILGDRRRYLVAMWHGIVARRSVERYS